MIRALWGPFICSSARSKSRKRKKASWCSTKDCLDNVLRGVECHRKRWSRKTALLPCTEVRTWNKSQVLRIGRRNEASLLCPRICGLDLFSPLFFLSPSFLPSFYICSLPFPSGSQPRLGPFFLQLIHVKRRYFSVAIQWSELQLCLTAVKPKHGRENVDKILQEYLKNCFTWVESPSKLGASSENKNRSFRFIEEETPQFIRRSVLENSSWAKFITWNFQDYSIF